MGPGILDTGAKVTKEPVKGLAGKTSEGEILFLPKLPWLGGALAKTMSSVLRNGDTQGPAPLLGNHEE